MLKPRFDKSKHFAIALNNCMVADCECFLEDLIKEITSDVKHIEFRNVDFIDKMESLFSIKNVKTYIFKQCKFIDVLYINAFDCILKFNLCEFTQWMEVVFSNSSLTIKNSSLISLHAQIDTANHFELSNIKSIKLLDIFGYKDILSPNQIIKEKTGITRNLLFSGFLSDILNVSKSIEVLHECEIVCDVNGDNIGADFGEIDISEAKFREGVKIINKNVSRDQFVTHHLPSVIRAIKLNFDNITTPTIVLDQCNVRNLLITGKNVGSELRVNSGWYRQIWFKDYFQGDVGSVYLEHLLNMKGVLLVKNSTITNGDVYFQNCDLIDWQGLVEGSLFRFYPLNSSMPKAVYAEGGVKTTVKLDTINTWLLNTDKDSDIINYHDLKKEQWKLVWQKRKDEKNGLSNKEKFQFWAQLSNDFGTNWIRALKWLIIPNLIFSLFIAVVALINRKLLSMSEVVDAIVEVFIQNITPFMWFEEVEFVSGGFLIFPFLLKIYNAVLIFQIVSAFRVYFKK